MEGTVVKIRISKDFSFAEFDVMCDLGTGEGLPTAEELRRIFDRLPGKDTQPTGNNGLRQTPESAKKKNNPQFRISEPPATANQRRVLERYGEWRNGMTKSEASEALKELGF